MSTAALVLTGGGATRMGGGDKPLLEVGGTPNLARIIAALRVDTHAIAISPNADPVRFARFANPIGMRQVDFPAGKWDPFLNVNTPEDLAVARSLVPPGEKGQP